MGTAGGFAADALNVPLAWMLGPLALCAIAAMTGIKLRPMPWAREAGQAVVGLAIGLRFIPSVLIATMALLPAMLVATIFVIVVTMISAFVLRPLARVERTTAFFATAAAGMADMAIVARERGGDADAVAVVHAIRMTAVVFVVPLLVVAFGDDGGIVIADAAVQSSYLVLALVLILCAGAALLLKPFKFPNPWLVGPMLLGATIGGTEVVTVTVPPVLIILAQLMIGIALGSRFQRDLIFRLPRVVMAATVTTGLLIGAAALGAAVLSHATGLSYATSFLALAPAGVTEMVITAKAMHLDTAAVTAFHMMRIAVIAATILLTFGIYERITRWIHGSRA
ncbi:AbrB family transcriptional regulator [Microvirga makkahensis]|uniref:AbrB family transcriptional regulator n=2 Tax=Microvirga makkahensis TaxID=1128670 RepID=A0A7X3MW91_9HYPH|nr:AbrB family transcriptional regulator [Microvirga makkahensis]